ncbi:uncharacterized protein [Amphiura filiformis]|uniref:uncharacterized protein n=1 Tax=Amphiura filiformis TaxID=82378 RepID=UPI003B226EA8
MVLHTQVRLLSRGKIFRQLFGAAMGSPVSPLAANIFMEHLEQSAIATAPLNCKPKLWKRYVDDILEVVSKDGVIPLTDHLNSIDDSNSIKFTFEEEKDGRIPFLDTLIVRRDDGSVKLLVYLNFASHHPLHQKLGVVRTLMDRKNKIITEDTDKEEEEANIKKALNTCGYPPWSIDRVKKQMETPREKKNTKKDENSKSKGMVVIPYVEGVSERIARTFKNYNIATAMKPHCTLRNMLVHPKDKRDPLHTTDVIYAIPCKNCESTYVGETGRKFGKRIEEHRAEAEKAGATVRTRASRKASESKVNKSAITDHVMDKDHIIDWEEARVVGKEADRYKRWIKEAIQIRKQDNIMNRDEGQLTVVQRMQFLRNNVSTHVLLVSIEPHFSTTSHIYWSFHFERSCVARD